ncbi:hypothetical protein NP493_577g01019 [Ridgeia piscesae]|uniref:Uncharacterized protein n=1 Tax=Ridgeia piscesae TaxID=27915 RepID=A0AAD9NR93_RIDPI|nr:hypothetical protein NP493_577g01019 [Ridgeia piscesae]
MCGGATNTKPIHSLGIVQWTRLYITFTNLATAATHAPTEIARYAHSTEDYIYINCRNGDHCSLHRNNIFTQTWPSQKCKRDDKTDMCTVGTSLQRRRYNVVRSVHIK